MHVHMQQINMIYIVIVSSSPAGDWCPSMKDGPFELRATRKVPPSLSVSLICCPCLRSNFDCGDHHWNDLYASLCHFSIDSGERVEVGSWPWIITNLWWWTFCTSRPQRPGNIYVYMCSSFPYVTFSEFWNSLPFPWALNLIRDSDRHRASSDLVYEHTTYRT